MGEKYRCCVCGRENSRKRISKDYYCQKHYSEYIKYGFCISDNDRLPDDPNMLYRHDGYVEMFLYDNLQEELDETVILDLDDYDKVKGIRFDLNRKCVTTKINGNIILLQNYLLDSNERIEFINGDYLDFRKDNLRIIKKKVKTKKNPYIINKKNKNKIIIEVIGKNRHQVTGSATLVSIPLKDGGYKKILIELGGSQTNKDLYTEYLNNKEIVDCVPHNEIDYVFALHSHFDHIGNLPSLIRNGFHGKLICNKPNEKLLLPILVDGAYIGNKNVRSMNNKKHHVEPLYTEEDVYLLMNRCESYSMNEIHKLDDIVSFQFVPAGHILGSCQLLLYCKTPTGQIKKLHFTSDLGSDYNRQPFVFPRENISSSNFSMFEATYNKLDRGFSSKKECEIEREEYKKFIKDELKNGRSILVGVFAQARQQSMMEFLYRSFKNDKDFNYPIYIDGVLGSELNNVYLNVLENEDKEYWREIMNWKQFKYITSYEKSLEVATRKDEIKLVLSSSGMFSNGRILNHLCKFVENPKCTIVLCGYQAEGCIGHELMREDINVVNIEGMEYKKRCKIYQMKTWSSHIMPIENIKYMSQINTPLIVLNHSDENFKYEFRDVVEEELRKRNNSAKVICANNDNNIFFI